MLEKNRGTIIIFSTAYLPYLGGAEIAIKGITDHVGDFNFVMLTARYARSLPPRQQVGKVMVYRLGFGTPFYKFLLPLLAFVKFFSVRMKISGPVMLWAMMVSYSSLAALFIKKLHPELPLLLTLQEGDSEAHIRRGRLGLIGFFWKQMIGKADYIQTISNYLKALAVSFGAAPNSIMVVPNGIDVAAFRNPDPILQEDIKSMFGIVRDDKVIFTASRLVHKNAADVIIESMQFLPRRAKLVIAGGGEDEQKLKTLAREKGVSDRVHFAGTVPNNRIPAYFAIAHVFVRPSRSEGLGVAFLEAMAAGTAIVATEVGGIKDFLRDGETGLVVAVDDPKDTAEKIDMLLRDEPLRQKLIANGRRLVEEKYQWSKISGQMKNIFRRLLFSNS